MASIAPGMSGGTHTTSPCSHKSSIGCALTALPVCCACADQRPMMTAYPIYIDGQGMKLQGRRWQRYCWRCRDYWNLHFNQNTSEYTQNTIHATTIPTIPTEGVPASQSSQVSPIANAQSASWSFSNSQINRPAYQLRNLDGQMNTSSTQPVPPTSSSMLGNDSSAQPLGRVQQGQPQNRRPFINPFGTREEIESEDYQSPLAGMFTRAWGRYRDAEIARQEESHNQSTPNPLIFDQNFGRESEETVDSNIQNQATSSIQTNRQVVRDATQFRALVDQQITSRFAPSLDFDFTEDESHLNPVDEQKRPTPLKNEDMMVSLACRICNEQKIDTLLEPCMHVAICHWCSELLRQEVQHARRARTLGHQHQGQNQWKCPICRRDIHGVRRVYLG